MRCTVLPNGDLRITACNEVRAGLAQAYRDGGYYGAESLAIECIREALPGYSPELIPPENIGALTDAPIIADDADFLCSADGYGFVPCPESRIWWFPNYAIIDPWEELKNRGVVVFDRAPE